MIRSRGTGGGESQEAAVEIQGEGRRVEVAVGVEVEGQEVVVEEVVVLQA